MARYCHQKGAIETTGFGAYAEFHEFTGTTVGYLMKKEEVLTVRIDVEINRAIRTIAREDERTVAWVARKLITEALEARGFHQSNDPERYISDDEKC